MRDLPTNQSGAVGLFVCFVFAVVLLLRWDKVFRKTLSLKNVYAMSNITVIYICGKEGEKGIADSLLERRKKERKKIKNKTPLWMSWMEQRTCMKGACGLNVLKESALWEAGPSKNFVPPTVVFFFFLCVYTER